MTKVDIAAMVLVLIGALNWGFVGLFNVDVIDLFFESAMMDRLIYLLIGTAAIFKIIYFITGRWTTHFEESAD
jgi:uncharacterized membrane protein YuzA (DUF378 family)